jgi:hypothetical protein
MGVLFEQESYKSDQIEQNFDNFLDQFSCNFERKRPLNIKRLTSNVKIMKKNFWEVVIRIAIAALTAALTALGTTSCMGYGPF